MKKNGFSLIELIATIAIMLVISVLVFYSITKVNDDTRQKSYDAKIKLIVAASKEWGNDHLNDLSETCTYVFVRDLIGDNYLVADDQNQTVLKNPLTNGSMNDVKICITYIYDSENINYKMNVEIID